MNFFGWAAIILGVGGIINSLIILFYMGANNDENLFTTNPVFAYLGFLKFDRNLAESDYESFNEIYERLKYLYNHSYPPREIEEMAREQYDRQRYARDKYQRNGVLQEENLSFEIYNEHVDRMAYCIILIIGAAIFIWADKSII